MGAGVALASFHGAGVAPLCRGCRGGPASAVGAGAGNCHPPRGPVNAATPANPEYRTSSIRLIHASALPRCCEYVDSNSPRTDAAQIQ